MQGNRVLVLGLDGGCWGILDSLIQDGFMPHLASLIASGSRGTLESTIPPVTAPAWATFQTGVLPGQHGIFGFRAFDPMQKHSEFICSRDIPVKTLWEIVSSYGKKVIAVNVPLTYPAYEINGCMVTCMLTPDTKGCFTYPGELSDEIRAQVPAYRIFAGTAVFYRRGLDAFLNLLIETERNRTEVMSRLMQRYDWDVAMAHFQSVDVLQHALCWHLDRNAPLFDRRMYERIAVFYSSIDHGIGRLVDLAGAGVIKIIMSDHGFGSVFKTINLNRVLARNGFLALREERIRDRLFVATVSGVRRLDVLNLHQRVLGKKRMYIRKRLFEELLIDWGHTSAYVNNGVVYGDIYINRARGDALDHEKVRERLMQVLADMRGPQGEAVLEKVLDRDAVCRGPYLTCAPDLFVVPKPGYNIHSTVLRDRSMFEDAVTQGNHRRDGIFVMQGEVIRRGQSGMHAGIEDVFPTILYLLGLPVPDYADGGVIGQAIIPEHLGREAVVVERNADARRGMASGGYDSGEGAVRQRLKSLGYL